jgi:hypothetical protein
MGFASGGTADRRKCLAAAARAPRAIHRAMGNESAQS